MVDVGELIGGIMSGITRARRDADMTAAMIAEEYKLNSLLSQVAAPRVRLAGIEVDLPVILNTAQGASTRKSGGSAITSQGVLQVLSTRLQEEQVSAELLTRFQTYAGRDLDILFGGEVSGISGEAISQIAQQSFTKALNESTAAPEGREKEPERGAKGDKLKQKHQNLQQSARPAAFQRRWTHLLKLTPTRAWMETVFGPSLNLNRGAWAVRWSKTCRCSTSLRKPR